VSEQGDNMKTKLLGLTALALGTSACGQGNLYPLPADQAYAKLVAAKILPSGTGPFGRLPIAVVGDGSSTIKYVVTDAGMKMCEANIAAEGDKSRITAFCDKGGEGAAVGLTQNLMRSRLIEHIDATLKGREFDPKLAMGSTAGSWPKDERQAKGNIGTAMGDALQMERDMKREIKEMDKMQEQERADAAANLEVAKAHDGVTFEPGKPMVDTSK
jgi:hypothetical protein